MEAIGDLGGLRGPLPGGYGILLAAIPAHQLNFRMLFHPGRSRFRFPIREEVNDLVEGEIDQNRAIFAATKPSKIIHAKLGHGYWWGRGHCHDPAQDRGG
jgi:hypothetical protein